MQNASFCSTRWLNFYWQYQVILGYLHCGTVVCSLNVSFIRLLDINYLIRETISLHTSIWVNTKISNIQYTMRLELSYPWMSSISRGCNSSSRILCILLEIALADLMIMLIFVHSFLTDAQVKSILEFSAPLSSKALSHLCFLS